MRRLSTRRIAGASNRSCAARSRTAARRLPIRYRSHSKCPRERVAAALLALDLDADIRGEALDLRTFAALAERLAG